MLPLIESALGIRSEPHDGGDWFFILVNHTLHRKKSVEYALPFTVEVVAHFILVPSRFAVALGHCKEYAVNKPVGGSLTVGKFGEQSFLTALAANLGCTRHSSSKLGSALVGTRFPDYFSSRH